MSVCGLQLDNLLIIDDRNSRTEYLLHGAASGRSQQPGPSSVQLTITQTSN